VGSSLVSHEYRGLRENASEVAVKIL